MKKVSCLLGVFYWMAAILSAQTTNYSTEATTNFENQFTDTKTVLQLFPVTITQQMVDDYLKREQEKTKYKVRGGHFEDWGGLVYQDEEIEKYLARQRKKNEGRDAEGRKKENSKELTIGGEFVHLVYPVLTGNSLHLPVDSADLPSGAYVFDEQKDNWNRLLQSFVNEEFIFSKKFDTWGMLTAYTTYGHGFDCPFFLKSCIDFFETENGKIRCRIHRIQEKITWNCTGACIFGCDTIKEKSHQRQQDRVYSEIFRQRRISFKKNGSDIFFELNKQDGANDLEKWLIITENENEIVLERAGALKLINLHTHLPKKIQLKNDAAKKRPGATFDFNEKITLNVISILGDKLKSPISGESREDLVLKKKFSGHWCNHYFKDERGKEMWKLIPSQGLLEACGGINFFDRDSCRENVSGMVFTMLSKRKTNFSIKDSVITFMIKTNEGQIEYERYKIVRAEETEIILGEIKTPSTAVPFLLIEPEHCGSGMRDVGEKR